MIEGNDTNLKLMVNGVHMLVLLLWLTIFVVQVGLLNVDGFYNSLLSFIDKAVDEGFISPKARRIIVSAPTAKDLVRELEVYANNFHFIWYHIEQQQSFFVVDNSDQIMCYLRIKMVMMLIIIVS